MDFQDVQSTCSCILCCMKVTRCGTDVLNGSMKINRVRGRFSVANILCVQVLAFVGLGLAYGIFFKSR